MHGQAHLTSAEMAQALGAYPRFAPTVTTTYGAFAITCGPWRWRSSLLKNSPSTSFELQLDHLREAPGRNESTLPLICMSCGTTPTRPFKHGLRNAEMTVIAPTGTIGFVLDCDTTGVEPLLGLKVFKQLVGGGKLHGPGQPSPWVSALDPPGLRPMRRSRRSCSLSPTTAACPPTQGPDGAFFVQEKHWPVFATALSGRSSGPGHRLGVPHQDDGDGPGVHLRCDLQDRQHAHEATIDDVRDAFRMAHDCGLKAVAIYRDGSKLSQPLTIAMPKKDPKASPSPSTSPSTRRLRSTNGTPQVTLARA